MRERVQRLSLGLSPDLAEYARSKAKQDGTSVSGVIQVALKGYRKHLRREQILKALAENEGVWYKQATTPDSK